MYTVGADRRGKIEKKEACFNCTASFGSSVKDRNYSGWSSEALEGDYAKFIQTLKNGQKTAQKGAWCKDMDPMTEELAKKEDLKKANASREAIKH